MKMIKNKEEFRRISMPYCLKLQPDGSYLVLNRNYKPLGFMTHEHVDYEQYPIAEHFARLGPKTIQKLRHGKARKDGMIFLYDDGCIPTRNKTNMKAYLEKLVILMRLDVY